MERRARAARGLTWVLAETAARHVLPALATMALARFISPEEFGVVATATALIAIAAVLVDAGLSAALIQAREASRPIASTVFWFQVGLSGMLALLIAGIASFTPASSSVQPVALVAAVLAPSLVLTAVTAVPAALWTRELSFRRPALALLVASTVGALSSLIAAIAGAGLWSLVLQQLVTGAVFAVLVLSLSPFRPGLQIDRPTFAKLAGFGAPLLFASLIETVAGRVYTVLARGAAGARNVGHYWSAQQLYLVPQVILTTGFGKVAFAVFALESGGDDRHRLDIRRLLRAAHLALLPWFLTASFLAEPLVGVAFGFGWSETAEIFRVLAWALIPVPAAVVNLSWLKAAGRSGDLLHAEIVKKTVLIALAVAGSRFGPIGLAWAVVAAAAVAFFVNARVARAAHGQAVLGQVAQLLTPLALAIVIAAGAWFAFRVSSPLGTAAALTISALSAAGMQLLLAKSLMPESFRDLNALARATNDVRDSDRRGC